MHPHDIAALCGAAVLAFLDLSVGARYCIKLIKGRIAPRMATWIIFTIGVAMSLTAFFTSSDHDPVKAALVITDGLVVVVILTALVAKRQEKAIAFNKNEKRCLAIAFATLVAWAATKNPHIGFAGFQIVMTVAYWPTLENLWKWQPGKPSPEPAETWAINALAGIIGAILDVTGTHHDYVAILYPLRAALLCLIVVAFAERWRWKYRHYQQFQTR